MLNINKTNEALEGYNAGWDNKLLEGNESDTFKEAYKEGCIARKTSILKELHKQYKNKNTIS